MKSNRRLRGIGYQVTGAIAFLFLLLTGSFWFVWAVLVACLIHAISREDAVGTLIWLILSLPLIYVVRQFPLSVAGLNVNSFIKDGFLAVVFVKALVASSSRTRFRADRGTLAVKPDDGTYVFFFPYLLFIAYVLFVAIWQVTSGAIGPLQAVVGLRAYLEVPLFLTFSLVAAGKVQDRDVISKGLLLAILWIMIYTLMRDVIGGVEFGSKQYLTRLSSIVDNPNTTGLLAAVGFALAPSVATHRRHSLLVRVVLLGVVLMTESRSALLALGASYLIEALQTESRMKMLTVLVSGLLAVVLLLSGVATGERFSLSGLMGDGRLEIWSTLWEYLAQSSPSHLLFGHGLASIGEYGAFRFTLPVSVPGVEGGLFFVDNQYLSVILELGLIGLVLWFLCLSIPIAVLLFKGNRITTHDGAALRVTVLIAVFSLFTEALNTFPANTFYWIYGGIALGDALLGARAPKNLSSPEHPSQGGLIRGVKNHPLGEVDL